MKKWSWGTILLSFFLLAGCQAKPALPTPVQNDQLAYFGFALVDCGFDAPNDAGGTTNYIEEVAGFTNIGQMCVFSPEEKIGTRLALFRRYGVKALLYVEEVLFEYVPQAFSPFGAKMVLRADAEARWSKFVALNQEVLTTENVAVLYLADEPMWRGLSEAELVQAVQIVETMLPELPTMVIEGYPAVKKMVVPEALDWIGFDRYNLFEPDTDEVWLDDLARVYAARTRADQKIVIIASTQWVPDYGSTGIQPNEMADVALRYEKIARSYPDVVALLGYVWPGGFDIPEQLGARDLPSVQEVLEEIGKRILLRK